MSSSIHISGPVAYMEQSGSAVFFSKNADTAGTFTKKRTDPKIKEVQNALKVHYWGEDNRFPQNIEQQMAYCGIGKFALTWKAKALLGDGIVAGKITDIDADGNTIFTPLKPQAAPEVYQFIRQTCMSRFWLEYALDWEWFANCFPEIIFSNDCSKITHFVHQESCDARFKQMNEKGIFDTVYLSKLWGSSSSQFVKFDPDKKILGILENPSQLTEIDGKYLISLDAIDMYDALNSAKNIADKKRDGSGLKSAILPVNFPSPNKTAYQSPAWDGARLGGWVEIACKIPSIIKVFLKKGLKIQYHIEIPEAYFEKKFGKEAWAGKKADDKAKARRDLLEEMDEFLTSENADFSTFISIFDYDPHNKTEYNRIKINAIEVKYNLDKELITSGAADMQILAAMGLHPTLIGAGALASGAQRTGGSDQREAFLIYCALLKAERRVFLEPLYLARDFNGWDPDIEFRIIDTRLTTLDKNKGTEKNLG